MINAGLSVDDFDGTQVYREDDGSWGSVNITVDYQNGQNPTDNPPQPGDIIFTNGVNIWDVLELEPSDDSFEAYQFNVRVRLNPESGTPSPEVSPDFGLVSRASILTPVKGNYAPIWAPTSVDSVAARRAAHFEATVDQTDNTADIDKVISTATQIELDKRFTADDLVSDVTLGSVDKPLASLAGKELATRLLALEAMMTSDDATVDTMQEAADRIKALALSIDGITIESIPGLDTRLDQYVVSEPGKGLSTNDLTDALAALIVENQAKALQLQQQLAEVDSRAVDQVKIVVNNFDAGDFSVPDGITIEKVMNDSSLKVTHSRGKRPWSWSGLRLDGTTPTSFSNSSVNKMTHPTINECVITMVNTYQKAEYILLF